MPRELLSRRSTHSPEPIAFALDALDDSGDSFALGGLLYCVSPLPEVNGDSSVSIPELRFQGLLDWSSS